MKKYKHKLNMLEPGYKIIKAIGIFGVLCFLFYLIKFSILCYLFGGLAFIIGTILCILLMIEQHQDKVLNEQAINERKRNGEQD